MQHQLKAGKIHGVKSGHSCWMFLIARSNILWPLVKLNQVYLSKNFEKMRQIFMANIQSMEGG